MQQDVRGSSFGQYMSTPWLVDSLKEVNVTLEIGESNCVNLYCGQWRKAAHTQRNPVTSLRLFVLGPYLYLGLRA